MGNGGGRTVFCAWLGASARNLLGSNWRRPNPVPAQLLLLLSLQRMMWPAKRGRWCWGKLVVVSYMRSNEVLMFFF